MSEKIYCGGGKKKKDNWRSISVNITKAMAHAKKSKSGDLWVNLNISDRDQPDQYGKDVTVTVDTWEPTNTPSHSTQATDNNDLPF